MKTGVDFQLLIRVIGITFYQRNAGFFLVAFLLLFGVVSPQVTVAYHLAIMQSMATSAVILLAAATVWLVYAFKCLHYGLKTLALPENEFLYTVSLLPARRSWVSLFLTQSFIYLPIWIYVLLCILVAVRQQEYSSAVAILVINVAFCKSVAWIFLRRIKHPNPGQAVTWLSQLFHQRFTKSYPAFFWSYLLSEEKVLFLLTKASAVLILLGALPLHATVDFDDRMLWLAYILAGFSHAVVVQQFRQYEETRLRAVRNLPWTLARRFGLYLLIYVVVLLPDLLVLIHAFSATFGWKQWLDYGVLSLSICMVMHSTLFIHDIPPDKYITWAFFAFVVLVLLVLYHLEPLLMAAGLLGLSFGLLSRFYYRYEWLAPPTTDEA